MNHCLEILMKFTGRLNDLFNESQFVSHKQTFSNVESKNGSI